MKRILFLCLAALALCVTSCRQKGTELMNPNTVHYNTPSEQFNAIWHGINNCYAFWDIDPTNWDSLYRVYSPRFEKLDEWIEKNYLPTDTLNAYYTDMCSHFIDHHMVIDVYNMWRDPTNANDEEFVDVRPGDIEVRQRSYYHEAFSDSLLLVCIENAGGKGAYATGKPGSGEYRSALACNFDGIAYLKLSGYMLTPVFNASDSVSVSIQNVYMQFHQWCAAKDLKGIILDNRGNRGGYINDLNYVVAPFLKNEMSLGHTRHKEGLGRYDYSPWVPYIVKNGDVPYHQIKSNYPAAPIDSIGDIDVPIVVLADINSVSMGEMTTQAIKQMPNGCFIGERTFGGHGELHGSVFEQDYGGSFGDGQLKSIAHYVYTSNNVVRDADGKITEGIGYTPTYEVRYDEAQMRAGTDVQLNAALNYIRTGKIN